VKKALIVMCHPNKNGFNQAIALNIENELKKDHEVRLINLYADHMDPLLPSEDIIRKFTFDETILSYQKTVKESGILIFVHPDWWGSPPAAMKGFIDRVFRPGIAYEFEGTNFLSKKKIELFAGKKAFVFMTTDYAAPEGPWLPGLIWQKNVFEYCGIYDSQIHTFFSTYNSSYEERKNWILQAGLKVRQAI
jgi:NAD(P)H dehydrogenase (quinone)